MTVSRFIPWLRQRLHPLRRACEHAVNRGRSAESVFTAIYRKRRWGHAGDDFHSGAGSVEEETVTAYVRLITAESDTRGFVGKSWLDLGCGDFKVGAVLRPLAGHYTAVDVVQPLIAHHQTHWQGAPVTFLQADLAGPAALPPADVVFIRQVLQHLSNPQIKVILDKLKAYPLVYITEHHPSPADFRRRNLDMSHGSGIRLYHGSGVSLTDAPFLLPEEEVELLLEVPVLYPGCSGDHGVLKTWCYRPVSAPPAAARL